MQSQIQNNEISFTDSNFCIDISRIPLLDIRSDFQQYLKDKAATVSKVYGYGSYDKEEMQSIRDYWESLGFMCSDEDWEEWERQCQDLEGDIPDNETIWPPVDEEEFHEGNVNKFTMKSQKFINGMEVDDTTFNEYNNKKETRRGGKKHSKKKVKKNKTRYNYEFWDEYHERPLDSCSDSIYANEEKKIVFHRTLNNTADTYEWDNLNEFNEWLDENSIQVDDRDISGLLYRQESHCCLDPNTTTRVLIVARSYGDLVWDVCGDDEELLAQYSQSVSNPV